MVKFKCKFAQSGLLSAIGLVGIVAVIAYALFGAPKYNGKYAFLHAAEIDFTSSGSSHLFRTSGHSHDRTPGSLVITSAIGQELGLAKPQGLSYDNGHLYVSDTGNNRVLIVDTEGSLIAEIGQTGSAPGEFIPPLGMTNGPDGNLYVADSGNNRVQIFTPQGQFLSEIPIAQFATPYPGTEFIRDVEVDQDGYMYVSTLAYFEERQQVHVYRDGVWQAAISAAGSSGLLGRSGDQVYYLADFQLQQTGGDRKLVPADTYLAAVSADGFGTAHKLKDGSAPRSIVQYNGHSYILHKPMPSIDQFDSQYRYAGTPFSLKQQSSDGYRNFTDMVVDEHGRFYCLDEQNNEITILAMDKSSGPVERID